MSVKLLYEILRIIETKPNLNEIVQAANNAASSGNVLFHGDNFEAMLSLLSNGYRGAIDLIYIDPPYNSNANYYTKDKQLAFTDKWENGVIGYLEHLYPRLVLMRELLSDKGSIYVHVDHHVSHYVRLLLDEVFGKGNFRNEISWSYNRMPCFSKCFQRELYT